MWRARPGWEGREVLLAEDLLLLGLDPERGTVANAARQQLLVVPVVNTGAAVMVATTAAS